LNTERAFDSTSSDPTARIFLIRHAFALTVDSDSISYASFNPMIWADAGASSRPGWAMPSGCADLRWSEWM